MQNIQTTTVSIGNKGIDGLDYTWNSMNDTWATAEYTWDNVELQTPPAGTAITNIQIS